MPQRERECRSGGCTALVCAGRLTDPRAPLRARRRCGSCANVYSKAYRAAGLRVSTAPMGAPLKQAPAAAVASLDLPRSRQGLQRYYQLVASTTGDLWCARRLGPSRRCVGRVRDIAWLSQAQGWRPLVLPPWQRAAGGRARRGQGPVRDAGAPVAPRDRGVRARPRPTAHRNGLAHTSAV